MDHTTSSEERVHEVWLARVRMLATFDQAGLSDLGDAMDAYVLSLMRLNGEDYTRLMDELHDLDEP